MKYVQLLLLGMLCIASQIMAGDDDVGRPSKTYFFVRPQFRSARPSGILGHPAKPIDLFANLIQYLPYDVRQRAWRHYEQEDYLNKGRMTLEDAANLARLYTHPNSNR